MPNARAHLIPTLAALALAPACAPQATRPTPSAAPPTLCVVRHAQALQNLDPPPEGLTPAQLDALTERGQAQARALRDALPPRVAQVWASPAQRAQQTAALLAPDHAVQLSPALRMLDGDLPWSARTAAWSDGRDPDPDPGESLAEGAARAQALLDQLAASLEPGQAAVVVTHKDLAALLLGALRGTPLLERPTRDALETGQMQCLPLR